MRFSFSKGVICVLQTLNVETVLNHIYIEGIQFVQCIGLAFRIYSITAE